MSQPTRAVLRLFARLVAALCLFVGCHGLVGDYEVVPGAATDDGTGLCRPGEWRCNREFLLECTADRTWELRETCATASQCNSGSKVCTVCPRAGDQRCVGARREACAPDRSRWDFVAECPAADQCSPGYCGPCKPGELQCSGENVLQLQVCNADARWQPIADCATAALCAASKARGMEYPDSIPECLPPVCEAGVLSCEGASLYRCRQGRENVDRIEVCASPALCEAALKNPVQGATTCAPRCTPAGAFRCAENTVEQCAFDQTEWQAIEECPVERPCDNATGQCGAPCVPGTFRCNSDRYESCTAEGTWALEQQCVTAGLCRLESPTVAVPGCQTPPCAPGDQRCTGTTLEVCNQDRTDYVAVSTCLTPELCACALDGSCSSGVGLDGCGVPACMPGDGGVMPLRCDPANAFNVQVCNESLNGWDLVTTCNENEFCYPPAPEDPCKDSCYAPQLCNGAELLDCTPDGPIHAADCATPTLCQCAIDGDCQILGPTGCGIPICGGNLPSYLCDGDGTLLTCDVGRNSFTGVECGSAALCEAGDGTIAGYCAVCASAGVVECNDDDTGIRTCSTDRKGYVQEMSCALGCLERPGASADYCAVCEEDELRCNGTLPGASRVRQCSDDRSALVDVGSVCASGCLDLGLADACAACQPNERRCSGTQLLQCNAARTALVPLETCNPSCIDDGIEDYCGECTPGGKQCNEAGERLLTCTAAGEFDNGAACNFGCIARNGDDVCAPVCRPGTFRCATAGGAANGPRLEECNEDGDGWTLVQTCGSPALCDAAGETCDQCVAGEYSCNAGALRDCDANGNWRVASSNCQGTGTARTCSGNTLNVETCDAGETCIEARDRCEECTTGEYSCSAGTLRLCDGTGHWVATTTNCSGTTLRTCGGAGNNTVIPQTCEMGEFCDDTGNQCDVCSPNTYRCVGGALEVCDATGQSSVPSNACVGSTLRTCDAGSMPTTSQCEAGLTCNGAGTACEECTDGETRCPLMGSPTLQVCSDGAWVASDESPCAFLCRGALPNAYCGECTDNTQQCDGLQPQTCTAGQWTDSGSACSGACLNGTCVECIPGGDNECPAEEPVCLVNNTCVECAAGETAACVGATPVCLGNTCVECTPGSSRCMPADQPQVCSPQGAWENGEACTGDTPVCNSTDGTCECDPMAAPRCSTEGGVEECVDGSWTVTEPCDEPEESCSDGVCTASL